MPISVLQRSLFLTSHVESSPTIQVSMRTIGTAGRGRNGGLLIAGLLEGAGGFDAEDGGDGGEEGDNGGGR